MERKELHRRLGLLVDSISFLESRPQWLPDSQFPTPDMVQEMTRIRKELLGLLASHPVDEHYHWIYVYTPICMSIAMTRMREAITTLRIAYPLSKAYPPREQCDSVPFKELLGAVKCLGNQVDALQKRIARLEDSN